MKKFEELRKCRANFEICKSHYEDLNTESEMLNVWGILYEIAEKVYSISDFYYGTALKRLKQARPYLSVSKDYFKSCFNIVEGYMNLVEDKLKMDVAYDYLKVFMVEEKVKEAPVDEDNDCENED